MATVIKMESFDPISSRREEFEFPIELPQKRIIEKRSRDMMFPSVIHQLLHDEKKEKELTIVQQLLLLNDENDEEEEKEKEKEIPVLIEETEVKEILIPQSSLQEEEKEEKVETEIPIISKKSRTKSDRTKKQKTQISREV